MFFDLQEKVKEKGIVEIIRSYLGLEYFDGRSKFWCECCRKELIMPIWLLDEFPSASLNMRVYSYCSQCKDLSLDLGKETHLVILRIIFPFYNFYTRGMFFKRFKNCSDYYYIRFCKPCNKHGQTHKVS